MSGGPRLLCSPICIFIYYSGMFFYFSQYLRIGVDNRDFAFFDVQVHTYTNECASKLSFLLTETQTCEVQDHGN